MYSVGHGFQKGCSNLKGGKFHANICFSYVLVFNALHKSKRSWAGCKNNMATDNWEILLK